MLYSSKFNIKTPMTFSKSLGNLSTYFIIITIEKLLDYEPHKSILKNRNNAKHIEQRSTNKKH